MLYYWLTYCIYIKGKWFVKWINRLRIEFDAEKRQLNDYISSHLVKEDIYSISTYNSPHVHP